MFNIPGNAYIVVVLEELKNLLVTKNIRTDIAEKCENMSNNIRKAIYENGTAVDENGKKYFLYEVDGLGKTLFMDDANVFFFLKKNLI